MIDASRRIAHYSARMLSSLIDPVLANVNALAVANFTSYVLDFYPKQVQLRDKLNSAGIISALFGRYEAFNGRMFHLYQAIKGPALTAAAQVLYDYWKGQPGVLPAVLANICLDVYGVTVTP